MGTEAAKAINLVVVSYPGRFQDFWLGNGGRYSSWSEVSRLFCFAFSSFTG